MEGLTYKIKREPKCVVVLNIEVRWEKVEIELEKIYKEIKREVRMPGFRRGNVPINILKQHYSLHAEEKLIKRLSSEVLGEILEKEKLDPVAIPEISDYSFNRGQSLRFNIKTEVSPDIQVKKYRKIKVVKNIYPIGQDDVEKTIRNLRENNASLKIKDSPVSKGDFVVAKFKVFRDSKEVDLGIPQESLIEIGNDTVLPDFSDKLEGMKKGEERGFDYEFPQNYIKPELRGAKTRFKVKVMEVKEKVIPSEDEISSSLGLESQDKLKESIKENLEKQMFISAENELDNKIIAILLEKNDFELPEGLVKKNFEKNKKQMADNLKKSGGDSSKIDNEKIMEKTRMDIKVGFLLAQIAQKENIRVTEEDRKDEEEKVLKIINSNDRKMAKKYVDDNTILTRKVFDFIKKNANIKNKEVKKKTSGRKK